MNSQDHIHPCMLVHIRAVVHLGKHDRFLYLCGPGLAPLTTLHERVQRSPPEHLASILLYDWFGLLLSLLVRPHHNHDGRIWVRQLFDVENKLTIPVLKKIHKIVYEKPYDFNPIDWLSAYLRKNFEKRKESRFFCSALVACIYAESGIIDPNTNWTIVRPSDFDENDTHLTWMGESHLEGLFQIE